MKLTKIAITILCLCATSVLWGQNTTKSFRINFINPGAEWDIPVSKHSIVSVNPGIGWNTSYASSRFFESDDGLTYFIAPFLDCSYMNIYNLKKRFDKGKNTKYNSGNYFGVRFISKFEELSIGDNDRESDIDFSISPTWGIRRSLGKVHTMLELRPTCYIDTNGNVDFFPVILHLKLGLNLK